MDFGLSEEQQQLKESARAFLSGECPTTVVRKVMASEDGYPRELYADIAKLGWCGLIVPEEFGGAGLGMLDMAMILEEGGYAAMPGPFLFSSVLAASALKLGGSKELNSKWLAPLAEGKVIGTVAVVESAGSIDLADIAGVATKTGAGWRLVHLDGVKMFVPYANVADFIVVVVKNDVGEIALYVVDAKAPGVTVRALKNLDLTRRVSSVELKGAPAELLRGGSDLFAKLIDVAAIAIAADSLGGTERALEMAVEYSKVREQFGKPIGSFQALKHAAAEIVAELEPSRALLWYAAYRAEEGDSREASMAKARLCDIYSRGTDRAVLMHGGIGFTWEHDMHLWFKRARFNESYFGSPGYHRERVAALGDY